MFGCFGYDFHRKCIYLRCKMNNNLIYNAEEVNGLKVSETVYKKDGNMLTNYMKYSYKYNANNQMTENMSQKWDASDNCWKMICASAILTTARV